MSGGSFQVLVEVLEISGIGKFGGELFQRCPPLQSNRRETEKTLKNKGLKQQSTGLVPCSEDYSKTQFLI